jgi:hypothetical protein
MGEDVGGSEAPGEAFQPALPGTGCVALTPL